MAKRKHNKYTPEWVGEVKILIPKTEKIKDDTGKEVDKVIIERLIEERKSISDKITGLDSDIKRESGSYPNTTYIKK
jgi:hypothetical protein